MRLPLSLHTVGLYSICLQLLRNSGTVGLGVVMLQMTSEEMANPREDLSASRKQELQQLLLEHMPSLLSALSGWYKMMQDCSTRYS